MPPKGRGAQAPAAAARGGGRGRGRGGGKESAEDPDRTGDVAKEFMELEESSVQNQSKLELLRSEKAAKRSGKSAKTDIRDDEGIDEEDPLINIDDGIRLEPFNMRREMAEGSFDEAGFYNLNKDLEKEVTDAWLDTVDQASKAATFRQEEDHKKAAKIAGKRIKAMKQNLGNDVALTEALPEGQEEEEDDDGTWLVEIKKEEGKRLGIGLDVQHNPDEMVTGDKVLIEDIDEGGLMAAWNDANPTKVVQAGDRILELNGETSSDAITGGLGKHDVLTLKFLREEKIQDEAEEEKDTASMMEELVGELLPLETPTEALARWRKGNLATSGKGGLEPLKTRARIKQDRAAENAKMAAAKEAAAAAKAGAKAEPSKRRKLNEWGDYEADSTPAAAPAAAPFLTVDAEVPAAAPSDAVAKESAAEHSNGAAGSEVAGGSSSSVLTAEGKIAALAAAERFESEKSASAEKFGSAAAIAAAEKFASEEKLVKEAAKVAAGEARMRRDQLYTDLDPSKGPESIALEEAQKKEAEKKKKREEPTPPPALAPDMKKRTVEPGMMEQTRRKKVERLTDLCDRLLERGVLVYESTREQLAIDCREKRGEFEETAEDKIDAAADAFFSKAKKPAEEKKPAQGEAATTADGEPPKKVAKTEAAAPPAAPVFTNKRLTSEKGESAVSGGLLGLLSAEPAAKTEDKGSAPATGRPLLWQLQWEATPDESHGPFDSVTMHGWMTQGCFNEERRAKVRQCDDANKATEQCWHPAMELNFALYM